MSAYRLGDLRTVVEGDHQVNRVMFYGSETAIVLIVVVESSLVIRDGGSAAGN